MAGEPGRRRSFWGALAAIMGGAFRLMFAAVAEWWRWQGRRETMRGKVLAYGAASARSSEERRRAEYCPLYRRLAKSTVMTRVCGIEQASYPHKDVLHV